MKVKLKEKFKSILLIALIITSLVFIRLNWFENNANLNLLPGIASIFSKEKPYSIERIYDLDVWSPRYITASIKNEEEFLRNAYFKGNLDYAYIWSGIKELISSLDNNILSGSGIQIDASNYKEILMGEVMFLEFENDISSEIVYGLFNNELKYFPKELSNLKQVIIEKGELNNVYGIYLIDSTKKIYKYSFVDIDDDYLKIIENIFKIPKSHYEYLFEKTTVISGTNEEIISTSGSELVKYVYAKNPLNENVESTSNILRAFGISKNSPYSYIDDEGSVYVSNFGSLRIDNDGFIQFNGYKEGILLVDEKYSNDYLLLLLEIMDFLYEIGDYSTNLYLISNMSNNESGNYEFVFDYVYEGRKIELIRQGQRRNAAKITVKNGKITNLEYYIRDYSDNNISYQIRKEILSIHSEAFERFGLITIDDMRLGYIDNGNRRIDTVYILYSGKNIYSISPQVYIGE